MSATERQSHICTTSATPQPLEEFFALFLSFVSLILNSIALKVFCVDEFERRSPNFSHGIEMFHRHPFMLNNQIHHHGTPKRTTFPRHLSGAKKSSATVGLLILSVCECTYAFGRFTFRLLMLIVPHLISPSLERRFDQFASTKMKIQILLVLENLLFFVTDVGLLCRNWCICLITMARAEAILWPLGYRCWQRVLRTRRWFLIAFLSIWCTLNFLAYLKHADYIGLLCFDSTRMHFALWMETFLMSEKQLILFELFGYHMIQTCLSWFVICVFTIVIVVRLKPWDQHGNGLFSGTEESLKLGTSLSFPHGSTAQDSALRVRHLNQIRATRIVLVIVLLFMILQFPSLISVALQCAGYVDIHSSTMRTLESVANTLIVANSIGNFFVFIFMLKHFRLMFLRIFCCCKPKS
ncbi:hypothetical protein FGIG_07664 [Fasciola gigantica]|uniref:G-protein coupled receptors family 1 profile domain-containing protein n=1 Tax=Fasciola gigantica TaxID=46835 RepID=A0A504Y5T1_FASGI|nr:hypothetical protein FGIG_07664 [Fasciola gigantica]